MNCRNLHDKGRAKSAVTQETYLLRNRPPLSVLNHNSHVSVPLYVPPSITPRKSNQFNPAAYTPQTMGKKYSPRKWTLQELKALFLLSSPLSVRNQRSAGDLERENLSCVQIQPSQHRNGSQLFTGPNFCNESYFAPEITERLFEIRESGRDAVAAGSTHHSSTEFKVNKGIISETETRQKRNAAGYFWRTTANNRSSFLL